ncbi:MAG TPA: TIR-like protein FxsC [Longimicrobium sp.]|nr:TIR-like protein FxsC [Longimicrobium sp.]
MDDPLFFLSYARNDQDAYLEKFYEELCDAVARWSGRPAKEVAFRDTYAVDVGEQWTPELAGALQTARVLVPLYSPSFFASEYCGKEWAFFRLRQDEHLRATPGAPRPPVILPVLWMPPEALPPLPQVASEIQYAHPDFGDEYLEEGLRRLRVRRAHQEVVEELAKRIVRAAQQHALPRAPDAADPAALPSAFAAPPKPGAPPAAPLPPPSLGKEGPRYVQCVYVAARRSELAADGARAALDGYGDESGMEWSPYLPAVREAVGLLVNDVTVSEGFLYTSLEVDDRLVERLEEAETRGKIVVLVVDPWTLRLEPYQKPMNRFDRLNLYNTVVLVPWNPGDPETEAVRADLETRLSRTFLRWSSLKPERFVDGIGSAEALKNELKVALTRARMRVINAAEVLKRAEGARPVPKPVVSGPGAAP